MEFSDISSGYPLNDFSAQLQREKEAFVQYQQLNYPDYKKARIAAHQTQNKNGERNAVIQYLEQYQPRLAVFAGSFNPFHKGHYNVLTKAENIFEKVIIAFGENPTKQEHAWPVPEKIKNRQIEHYNSLLTDFIFSLNYDVVVVRGLRNSTDFQYEQNQYRYLQELKPDIKIVNIFCDKEYEHISSSGIRTLKKYNKHQHYLLD